MSLIEEPVATAADLDRAAADLFVNRLLPAAEALAARVGPLLAEPDAAAESYWKPRKATKAAKKDFVIDLTNPARAMAEFWEGRGEPELAQVAQDVADLARDVRTSEEQDAEVSPFIYVMF